MTYQCNRCGRAFGCEETISFCPFCGTAYAMQSAIPQPMTTRIVIGSDSERTVQEKYWRMARIELHDALSALDAQIPDEDDHENQQLDLDEWLHRQKKCRSTGQFKQNCDMFIRKISAALMDAPSQDNEQVSIDIDLIGKAIEQTCVSLAESLDRTLMPETLPVLTYEPRSVEHPQAHGVPRISEAYHQLLRAVEDVKPALYAILDENGVFVALSVLGNLSPEDAVKRKPVDLSTQLRELAEKDYDPLFGEEYDDFVQAFWEALLRLAYVVNNALALPEMDDNELAKIDALQSYLADWRNVLNVMLDQIYQSQQQDMVQLQQRIQQLNCTFEEKESK